MKVAKLPRARAMWAHPKRMIMCRTNYDGDLKCYVCAPMPSRKSARQRAKFENLSEGEKVERLAEAIFTFRNPTEPWKKWRKGAVAEGCIEYAHAAIAVMEGRTL